MSFSSVNAKIKDSIPKQTPNTGKYCFYFYFLFINFAYYIKNLVLLVYNVYSIS